MTRGTTYIDTPQLEATRQDTPRKREEGEGSRSRTKIEGEKYGLTAAEEQTSGFTVTHVRQACKFNLS